MATSEKSKLDLAQVGEMISSQFRGLNPNDPGSWPLLPKILVCIGVVAALLVGGWFAWLSGIRDELLAAEAQEVQLKEEYRNKLTQAINLEELKRQKELVAQYVRQLEKQLPSKAEMDALLSDINQAGIGRGLQFDLFQPGSVVAKQYYAELPIAIKMQGGYHEMAQFATDIANLSRIVTLNNVVVTATREGQLLLDTQAKTFRYLDPEEIAAQRAASAPKPGQPK
jgi:type IV pilus assembly protein PilO